MTPKEWLKINTKVTHHKDGSVTKEVDPSAKKQLVDWETAIGDKLAVVRQYLADHTPKPTVNQYSKASYIDYYNMNTSLTNAEKQTQDSKGKNGLTHLQTSQRMSIPVQGSNPNVPTQYVHKFCAVTILHYKALDLPVGIIPVHTGGYNKGAKMNNNSQNFGGSLTTAKRQSLSLVFGIAPKNGDNEDGQFPSGSGWNNNSGGGWNNAPRRSGWNNNRSTNRGNWNNQPANNQPTGGWNNAPRTQSQPNRPVNTSNNGGSGKNFRRAGASHKKVSSKLTVSRPQPTITKTQYNNLNSLIKRAHKITKQPASIYVNFIRSAGKLPNSTSILKLPRAKYGHVLNSLKTMIPTK